jgi:hypothetical protein
MKAGWIALFSGLLAACATSPVPTGDTSMVPAERLFNQALTTHSPGCVSVIVKRDSGFLGGGCGTFLYVDGVKVADLHTSERIELCLASGERILSVEPTHCFSSGIRETKATVAPGSHLIFRTGGGDGGLFITPTAF